MSLSDELNHLVHGNYSFPHDVLGHCSDGSGVAYVRTFTIQ